MKYPQCYMNHQCLVTANDVLPGLHIFHYKSHRIICEHNRTQGHFMVLQLKKYMDETDVIVCIALQ